MSEEVALGSGREVDQLPSSTGRLSRAWVRRETRHAVKYGLVGVTNVTIDFTLYAALVFLGLWYPLAKTVSLVVATANGYTLNRIWTFRAGSHCNIMLSKYVTVQALCLAGNLALLIPLVEIGGLHKVTAQAIVLPIIALASFLAQRLWTFRNALR